VLSSKDRDTELSTRRNEGSIKVVRNGTNKGIGESPILSSSKLPERSINGMSSAHPQGQVRLESFRIRANNQHFTKSIQQQQAAISATVAELHQPQTQVSQPDEYQSIFNAYTSPPIKLRQSGVYDKKLKNFIHSNQSP